VFEKSAMPREETAFVPHRDCWWHSEIPQRPDYCPPEWMDAGGWVVAGWMGGWVGGTCGLGGDTVWGVSC